MASPFSGSSAFSQIRGAQKRLLSASGVSQMSPVENNPMPFCWVPLIVWEYLFREPCLWLQFYVRHTTFSDLSTSFVPQSSLWYERDDSGLARPQASVHMTGGNSDPPHC